jgi:hypothetical protein
VHTLSQADLLGLWELGRELHPLDQGLLAIHAGFPETHDDSPADWPIGRRNRALAQLRLGCFGAALRGWTSCRECGEKLEFDLNGSALAESSTTGQGEPVVVNGQTFRLPTSRDLARIAAERDPQAAATLLFERCKVGSRTAPPDRASRATECTEDVLDAVGEEMALADPLAEIVLHFDCPACGRSFDEDLDLPSFFWAEVEGRAKRMLLAVHILASAYGWSEAEILSLSAARRDFYLAMVHA